MMRMVMQVDKRIESGISLQIDATPTTTVTAIGAAHRHELRTVKVLGAAAAVTGANMDLYVVIKLHDVVL
jgi:hypothetical protein